MGPPINAADDKPKGKVDENNSDNSAPFNTDAGTN
jgi:hypothetical protein